MQGKCEVGHMLYLLVMYICSSNAWLTLHCIDQQSFHTYFVGTLAENHFFYRVKATVNFPTSNFTPWISPAFQYWLTTNFFPVCSHGTVKGLYAWCQKCGHGGHLHHIQEWYRKNSFCPAGCGHECIKELWLLYTLVLPSLCTIFWFPTQACTVHVATWSCDCFLIIG